MRKKAHIFVFFSILLIVFLMTGCSSGNTTEKSNVIKIGTTSQSFPNSYREDGELVGYDVEIVTMVAENLGYEIEWVVSDFSGLMGQLASKQIDTVANQVAITEARSDEYIFTSPYSYAGISVVTHEDNSYEQLGDLEGKKVGGVLGSENVQALMNFNSNIDVTTYQNRESAIQDTVMKRIDGYVNLEPNLIASINKDKLPFKFVGEPFEYQEIAYPFDKTNSQLCDEFSEEIEKLRNDGSLCQLSKKYYFDYDISVKDEE